MKFSFSLLFIFFNLFGFGQIRDSIDTDKDGVFDFEDNCPNIKGQKKYNGCDCISIYNGEKEKFEKDYNQLKQTNFKNFFEELFSINILKQLILNKSNILLLSEIRYDSEEGDITCPHYEKKIDDEILKKLWDENNFKEFQNELKNKIIINRQSFENNIKSNFLLSDIKKRVYKGIYIDLKGNIKNFFYFSILKPSKKLILHQSESRILKENFIEFGIKITPIEIKNRVNTYKVLVLIINEKDEIKSEEFIFQNINEKWIKL